MAAQGDQNVGLTCNGLPSGFLKGFERVELSFTVSVWDGQG